MTIETAAEWIRLRESSVSAEYESASYASLPVELWHEIMQEPSMRVWVVRNKQVPLEVLQLLARDEGSNVRLEVVTKRKLDADTLAQLAVDPDEAVRYRVARHRRTPVEALETLADDWWEPVRTTAAARLQALAKGEPWSPVEK